MKRVNISLSDSTYELLRKQAFEAKVQPGTLAARWVGNQTEPPSIVQPTLTPMSDVACKQEGHVIVENHETGYYEDFKTVSDYVAYYGEKMKSAGASHQAISGFKRRKP